MAGRWKTLFIWVVIAAAGLIYMASFILPVVAAMEQAVATVSEKLPSLVNDTISTIMTGAGEPEPDTTTANAGPGTTPQSSQTAPPQEDAIDISAPYSGATLPGTESTALDSATPAPPVSEPLTLLSEDLLAAFMRTRVGLVPSGTTNFPAHNVNITGEFVFQAPFINGSHFGATKERDTPTGPKARPIPTGYSAFTAYNNGTMNGFNLYRNMNYSPYYSGCYLAISAGGTVSFNGLSMEITELYGQQLMGVRTFLIPELWTTNPGEDLPLGSGEVPPVPPDDLFSGNNFKVTVIKMTASYLQIRDFSLSVRPGRK